MNNTFDMLINTQKQQQQNFTCTSEELRHNMIYFPLLHRKTWEDEKHWYPFSNFHICVLSNIHIYHIILYHRNKTNFVYTPILLTVIHTYSTCTVRAACTCAVYDCAACVCVLCSHTQVYTGHSHSVCSMCVCCVWLCAACVCMYVCMCVRVGFNG